MAVFSCDAHVATTAGRTFDDEQKRCNDRNDGEKRPAGGECREINSQLLEYSDEAASTYASSTSSQNCERQLS